MLGRIKRIVIGTPLEAIARRLYIRIDPSEGGRYDRETLAIMRKQLSAHSNCIDIGAHRGAILREITALSPAGTHYAFEPVPQHYQYLVKSFPKVKVFPLALSNVKQQRNFTHVVNRPTRSGFATYVETGEHAETIEVQTDLLDHVVPEDMQIHFIKLDVEGAEYEVLQGAQQTILHNRPLIVFEHSLPANPAAGAAPGDLYDLLSDRYQMKVSLLSSYLKKGPALNREEFCAQVEHGLNFYFLAYPK